MNDLSFDSISERELDKSQESSRSSVASFWIGVSGLAVISHIAIFLALKILSGVNWVLATQIFPGKPSPSFWEARGAVFPVFAESLLPYMVIATVVPILFWRGGLGQRFAISTTLAITTMNSSLLNAVSWNQKSDEIQSLLAILGCWLTFPILLLYTPIRTVKLRLLVAMCLLILTVCVSVIYKINMRRNYDVLSWVSLYGAAFLFTLIQRKGGHTVLLESDSSPADIERTSTRTLMELTTVVGLALALIIYLSEKKIEPPIWYFAQRAITGVFCAFACATTIQAVLDRSLSKKWLWVLFCALMWLVFVWNGFASRYLSGTYSQIDLRVNLRLFFASSQPMIIGIAAFFATAYWLSFLVCIGSWLKFCGWSVTKNPKNRFNEADRTLGQMNTDRH